MVYRDTYTGSWLHQVVSACQVFAGEMIDADANAYRRALARLARDTPRAQTVGHLLVKRLIMIELALNLCRHLHRRYPAFREWDTFGILHREVLRNRRIAHDPLRQFLAFAERCIAAVPPPVDETLAARIKAQIDRSYPERVRTRDLASGLGERPVRVDRIFRRVYGVSAHAYARGKRVREALALLADRKTTVDEISRRVGYRSKKDLYAALMRDTGLTPLELRRRIGSR